MHDTRQTSGVDFLELWRRTERYSSSTRLAVVVGLFAIGVVADAATGPTISMLLGYSVVVAGAAWFVGRRSAIAIALGTGVATSTIQAVSDQSGFPTGIVLLNAVLRTLSLMLLALVVVHQRRLVVVLRDASVTDSLTGILNRSGAMERLRHELERSRRMDGPLSVAYLDLDGLKERNDRLGHAAGDDLIVQLTDAIRSTLRSIDAFGRMGGDEFLVVLADTDVVGARQMLQRLFMVADLPAVSVGMLCFGHVVLDLTADEVIRRVDEVMYAAKRSEPVGGVVDDDPSTVVTRNDPDTEPILRKWRIAEA